MDTAKLKAPPSIPLIPARAPTGHFDANDIRKCPPSVRAYNKHDPAALKMAQPF
jgi:hypothetical protein